MKKPPRFSWPIWLPYPSCWLKALLLVLWMSAVIIISRMTMSVDDLATLFQDNLEQFLLLGTGILLSPIFVITIAHHLFHFSLSRWFSKHPRQWVGRLSGIFPGLISWWEGLYGWFVIILSSFTTVGIYTLILRFSHLNYETIRLYYQNLAAIETVEQTSFLAWFTLLWISNAAILYQVEYLMKQSLAGVIPPPKAAKNRVVKLDAPANADVSQLLREMGVTTIKGKGKLPKTDTIVDLQIMFQNPQRQAEKIGIQNPQNMVLELSSERSKTLSSSSLKNLFIFLLVPLLMIGIYKLFQGQNLAAISSMSDSRISVPTPPPVLAHQPIAAPAPMVAPAFSQSLGSSKKSESSSGEILLPPDPYQLALKRANSAAIFTKSAKSKADWDIIANQWQDALELMKIVPAVHPNYKMAQKKVIEYQRNLNQAQKRAENRDR